MSAMTTAKATAREESPEQRKASWALWSRQAVAILKLELRKNFLGRRSILIYLLALLPVFLVAMLAVVTRAVPEPPSIRTDFGEASVIFAGIYGGLILRTIVFFGC